MSFVPSRASFQHDFVFAVTHAGSNAIGYGVWQPCQPAIANAISLRLVAR